MDTKPASCSHSYFFYFMMRNDSISPSSLSSSDGQNPQLGRSQISQFHSRLQTDSYQICAIVVSQDVGNTALQSN